MTSGFEALIFDVDGTIADTERDGHRVAFNRAFERKGLDIEWDVEKYGRMLQIAGGKERIGAELAERFPRKPKQEIDSLVAELHEVKTRLFMEIVERGELPVRPGIKRLVTEAHEAGLKLAVASTSNEKSVRAVLNKLLSRRVAGWFDLVLAGDVVGKKKPDPEIYDLCAKRLGVEPACCMVVEDSRNGLIAARAAGMKCVVAVNGYTKDEELAEADLVVDTLGDPGSDPPTVLCSSIDLPPIDMVSLGLLATFFER